MAVRLSAGTHWIGGWVGPRTGLDDVENKKPRPYRDSNSKPSTIQPIDSRYTDCAFPAPNKIGTSWNEIRFFLKLWEGSRAFAWELKWRLQVMWCRSDNPVGRDDDDQHRVCCQTPDTPPNPLTTATGPEVTANLTCRNCAYCGLTAIGTTTEGSRFDSRQRQVIFF
jgi:hypothetical protein